MGLCELWVAIIRLLAMVELGRVRPQPRWENTADGMGELARCRVGRLRISQKRLCRATTLVRNVGSFLTSAREGLIDELLFAGRTKYSFCAS